MWQTGEQFSSWTSKTGTLQLLTHWMRNEGLWSIRWAENLPLFFNVSVPISCDLCEVELANGQELQDHLEVKSHWDTLEHIQKQSNYNDMTIAFLQVGKHVQISTQSNIDFTVYAYWQMFSLLKEVMLSKSRECSRAIEDNLLQGGQFDSNTSKHCEGCVFILDNYPLNAMFLFFCGFFFAFCSASGKWPHDKGWSLPLCCMQRVFIHIVIGGAFSPHFPGTPLQYKGSPLTLVGWGVLLHLLHITCTCKL